MLLGRIIPLFVLLPLLSWGQTAPHTWWVQFTDKDQTPYSIDAPEMFLSERSIQRREMQHIPVDESDLPVDPAYVAAVLALGDVELRNRSRWFNAITVRTDDPTIVEAIGSLPFVADIRSTQRVGQVGHLTKGTWTTPGGMRGGEGDYGASLYQLAMMNGHLLHLEWAARGEGMLIGVLDSGFDGVDTLSGFQDLRDREGILLAQDLAEPGGNVYVSHSHGRAVLSAMAAVRPGELVGSAPNADYALVRTEDAGTEFLIEEDNWVSGAELLDSLGCDVLNTSLGYTVFDDSTMNHTTDQLDGLTARISIAAGMASAKGMIPVNSAGNRGGDEWYYMSMPADAHNILAVGSVNADSVHSWFSGHGPSADGRVKPDVAALGENTLSLGGDGTQVMGLNGTSLASPLVAGLVACLWQLHPERSANDVMDAVRRSASQWAAPDHRSGYGIPDFMWAHNWLLVTASVGTASPDGSLAVFPVPFQDHFNLQLPGSDNMQIIMHDALGRVVWRTSSQMGHDRKITAHGLGDLPTGAYVIRVSGGSGHWSRMVMKAP